jgi:hypothetical protein
MGVRRRKDGDLSSRLVAKARRIQSDTNLFADDMRRHRTDANPPEGGAKQ